MDAITYTYSYDLNFLELHSEWLWGALRDLTSDYGIVKENTQMQLDHFSGFSFQFKSCSGSYTGVVMKVSWSI